MLNKVCIVFTTQEVMLVVVVFDGNVQPFNSLKVKLNCYLVSLNTSWAKVLNKAARLVIMSHHYVAVNLKSLKDRFTQVPI